MTNIFSRRIILFATSSRLKLAASSEWNFNGLTGSQQSFQVSVTTHFNYNMNNLIEGLCINQCDSIDRGLSPT